MTATSTAPSYRRLFGNRNFMALFIGQLVSFIGDYFEWLAIPILVERLTGSALLVGLSVISSAVPALVLGPIAGVFVDRWDRKKIMVIADVLRGLLVLLCLLVHTKEQVWIFYVATFLMSCVSRFFQPSMSAVVPLIVEKDDLLQANGVMQIIQTVGMLAGPALAGFVIGFSGAQAAFIFDSFSFFFSAIAILTMRIPRAAIAPASGGVAGVWNEMRQGLSFLFGSRVLTMVMVCLAVIHLGLGAVNVAWVPYMSRTFGVGAEGLGIVDSAQGVGMVLGGVLLGLIARRLKVSTLGGVGVFGVGLFLGLMGIAPAFWVIIALSPLVGFFLVPAQAAISTLMQTLAPDAIRGRVASVISAIGSGVGLISMAGAAALGELVGLGKLYMISGAITCIAGLLALFMLKVPEQARSEMQPKMESPQA